MSDFFKFTDVGETIQAKIDKPLGELEKTPLSELLIRKYEHGLSLICCPFCPRKFEDLDNLIKHFREKRWEFDKLLRVIKFYPKYFEYHELLYDEFPLGKMQWKLKRWVMCCKLMEKINPYGLHPTIMSSEKRRTSLYTCARYWLNNQKK